MRFFTRPVLLLATALSLVASFVGQAATAHHHRAPHPLTVPAFGEAPASETLSAYPNPVSASRDGSVTVTLNQKAGADASIRLLNVIGRVVREVPVRHNENGEVRLTLDIENLPAGVYFYALVTGERVVETHRLVVQP